MVKQIQVTNSNNKASQAGHVTTRPSVIISTNNQVPKKNQYQPKESFSFDRKRNLLTETTKAHYQTAQAQTAEDALTEAKKHLEQLLQVTRRSLTTNESKRTQLQQQLNQLKSKLKKITNTKFDDKNVLHQDFTIRNNKSKDQVKFALKGLRLNTLRNHPEILRFQVEGKSINRVYIEPDDSSENIASKLSSSLSHHSISVGVDKFDELTFQVEKQEWPKVCKAIWMSGGGQILPSGNLIKARMDVQDDTVDGPEGLDFTDAQSTRLAIAQIGKMLQKVELAMADLTRVQQEANQDLLRHVAAQQSALPEFEPETPEISKSWFEQSEDAPFMLTNKAVSILLAQANASRDQVVALLQP